MSRLYLLPLALAATAAPLAAQHRASWGDELPVPTPMPVAARPDTTPWPAPPALAVPSPVRALYVNAWAFGTQRFGRLLDLVSGTEVNSLVIDVKDDTGYLTYRSDVPTAIEIGANTQLRARDTRAR
ncbi:MAG: putative glycoside hydrolase, partial [Gemmatimonadales bacterium]